MKDTVTIQKIGRSIGFKIDKVILDALNIKHHDQIKVTVSDVVKGDQELMAIDSSLIFYGNIIKTGSSFGITIKKRKVDSLNINIGDVLNVDIEKIE